MKAHFATFAAYNAWANRRLYDACSQMDDAARHADAGAFFGSLFGTLNHLLCTDQIWMRRFTGAGPAPTSLSDVPFEAFDDLRAARTALDARIAEYVGSLTERDIERLFSYTSVTLPDPITQPLGTVLAHMFNHQTHHRGQCHHMLTAAGHDAPPLDLMFFRLET